jgi:hypothetical protein
MESAGDPEAHQRLGTIGDECLGCGRGCSGRKARRAHTQTSPREGTQDFRLEGEARDDTESLRHYRQLQLCDPGINAL